MCTSLTLQSNQGHYFLARTMDFDFELNGQPIFIPRQHTFKSDLNTNYSTRYAFIGTGRHIGDHVLIDGVNEHGLGGAALYFNESVYQAGPASDANQINLAPHEVLNWVLGNYRNISELAAQLNHLNIVAAKNQLLNLVVPLHWLLADQEGRCYVLEAQTDGLKLLHNPVGVMTNSPEFQWHLQNLRNYNQLQPEPHPHRHYGELTVSDFGPGSGTIGLPGDYTSPARFVRAVYLRNRIEPTDDDLSTLNALIHLLNNFDIPLGVKKMTDNINEYTQYRAYFNLNELTYDIQPYQNQTIYQIKLDDHLLHQQQVIKFSVPKKQMEIQLNPE